MNTILIYPKLDFSGTQFPTPPYSILFIADYLTKRNIEAQIFDLRYDTSVQLMNAIANNEPEYIGISVMTGPQISHALKISESIKREFKDIKIVWGGVHSTILPTQTLQNHSIDFVIRGEGERIYHDLIAGKNKNQIKGLSFKKNKKMFHNADSELLSSSEINELSIPWDLIDPKRYVLNGNFNMITSRGCPFKCAFCYNTSINNIWRGWTAEKCVEEFDRALEFGAKKYNFYDDNFFANLKRIKALFKYFKEKDISWKSELRVDRLSNSLAKEAKEHGCKEMYFGVESGSSRLLNLLNKNISIRDIIRSAQITRNNDIAAEYSWMVGIPSETKRDIRQTITLIKKINEINKDCEFSIKILFPYPKTMIYNLAIDMGFTPPSNLINWAKIRREHAPKYLNNRRMLETISITSALNGLKIFQQENMPIFKLIGAISNFRWRHEFFYFGFESFYYKLFREVIEKVISKINNKEYDPFLKKIISTKKE